MAQKAVWGVYLHLNEGKHWARPASGTGPAPAAAGSGETASAGHGDSARFAGGAICDLRKSGLQVRQGRAAWADLVSDRYSGTGPHHRRHHPRGESGGSPRLDRELPQGEGSPRKDFRDQPGTAAARARQAAQAQTKGIANARRGNQRSSRGLCLAFMRRQDRPVHELPSLARYLNKVFDFRATAATLTDSRVAPEIPPSAVFLAAFQRLCLPAAQLSATGSGVDPVCPPAMDRRRRAFRDDVLRCSLSGFHPEGLERMLVQVNRTLKRNQAVDTGPVQGRIVAALDGIEVLSSYSRCCDSCLERRVSV